MFALRLSVFTLLCVVLAACSSRAPTPAAPAVDAVAALTRAIADDLGAIDVLIAEGAKVDETLARQEKKLFGARVDRRLPVGKFDTQDMSSVLNAYAKMHGLGAVQLKMGQFEEGPALPTSVPGTEPFAYEMAQLIATVPVAISVNVTDPDRLQSYYEAIRKLQLPLMQLPTLLVAEGKATYSGSAYFRRDLTPPKRVHVTPTLVDRAAKLGVELPTDAEALKSLTSMQAQLTSKGAAHVTTLEKHDKVLRQARILQFLRTRSKEIGLIDAPKTVTTSAPTAPKTGEGAQAP